MLYIIAMIRLFYLTERAEMLIFTGFVPYLLKDKGCLLVQGYWEGEKSYETNLY